MSSYLSRTRVGKVLTRVHEVRVGAGNSLRLPVLFVVGPTGSGKTQLTQALCRLLPSLGALGYTPPSRSSAQHILCDMISQTEARSHTLFSRGSDGLLASTCSLQQPVTETGNVCCGNGGSDPSWNPVLAVDSVQVYRGLDVGSGKAPVAIRRAVPHYFTDVVDPWFPLTVALATRYFRGAVAGIHSDGRVPLCAGGAVFYLSALLHGCPTTRVRLTRCGHSAGRTFRGTSDDLTGLEHFHSLIRFALALGQGAESAEQLGPPRTSA